MMRLDRLLVTLAIGSRRDVQALIRQGLVSRNGEIARDPGMHVEETDQILVRGQRIDTRLTRHVMLNKPEGLLTAARDKKQRTVMDLFPPEFATLACMPVGRLDRDTTGLLLLTTDGELAHRLLAPQRHVDKTYRAEVDADLTAEDVRSFAEGLDLGDFTAAGARLVMEGPRTGLVTIHEGKFHQVRRMFEKVGKEVLRLDRLSFGPLSLDPSLGRGAWRELTEDEVRKLYESAKMEEKA